VYAADGWCVGPDVDEVADGFGQPAAGIAQQFTMLKAPESVDKEVTPGPLGYVRDEGLSCGVP